MSLWMLNHMPTWLIATLVLGGFPVLAALGCLVVRRRFPTVADGENNEVAGVVLSILGGIYGIVLAFVIVVLWEQLQDTQTVVADEATTLSQMVRDSEAFPPENRDDLHTAVGTYVRSVVLDEWPAMEHGRQSHKAERSLDKLYHAVQSYEPAGPVAESFYGEVTSKLDDVIGDRKRRIRYSGYGLPGVLQGLLVGGAFMIIGILYAFGTHNRPVHLFMCGAVAALLAVNLLLVLLLEHPFSGEIAVSNRPFKSAELARFWTGAAAAVP